VIFREIPQNERLFQRTYISLNETGVDVVVFGSSRANQFSSEVLEENSTFNHFLSGASIEDYLALSQLLYEALSGPETVVLTVDPWLFNRFNGQGRWIALGAEYNRALRRLGLDRYVVGLTATAEHEQAIRFSGLSELLSFAYLKASIKEVWEFDLGFGNRVRILREGQESDHRVKRPDGSQVCPADGRNRSLQAVTAAAIEIAHPDTDLYSLRNFDQIDAALQEMFEALVFDIVQRGITVELVLIPYHPIVYEAIEGLQKYGTVLDVEKYLSSYAKANDLRLRGSYNPVPYECGPQDFFDGLHPKASCLVNVLTKEPPPPPTIAEILGPTGAILSLVDPEQDSGFAASSPAGAVFTWSKPLSDFDSPPDRQADLPVVTFNGTDEAAAGQDSAYWSMLGARSLGGWVRLDTESDDGALMGKYDTRLRAPEWRLRLSSGHWELVISDASEEGDPFIKTKIDAAAKLGTWEFVVFTYDGSADASGISAYVDGVLATSTDVDQSGFVISEDLGADVGLGGYQDGSFFSGDMAAGPLGPFYTQVILNQKAVSDLYALGIEALGAETP
jgi:hypothetical protein